VTVLENKMGSRLIETYCHPQKNIKPKHATSSVQCSFACHFLNKTFKPKILYYLSINVSVSKRLLVPGGHHPQCENSGVCQPLFSY